jgi:hypothetical protein
MFLFVQHLYNGDNIGKVVVEVEKQPGCIWPYERGNACSECVPDGQCGAPVTEGYQPPCTDCTAPPLVRDPPKPPERCNPLEKRYKPPGECTPEDSKPKC